MTYDCPDCEQPLRQIEDSGHWICDACDWTGIIDEEES